MSRYNVARPESAPWSPVQYIAAAAVTAALLLIVARAFMLVPVVIDGRAALMTAGAPASEIPTSALTSPTGAIRAASDGRLVSTSGGRAPKLLRDGRLVASTDRIRPQDSFESRRGEDTTESVVTRLDPIAFTAEVKGSGSFITMERPGSVGLLSVRTGRVSGDVIEESTVTAAVSMVLHRAAYEKGTKVAALTFDDGPWPTTTEQILKILRDEKVPATFFVIGRQAVKRPALVRAILADGHDIGSHTQNHAYLGSVTPNRSKWEIAHGDLSVRSLTKKRVHWFRPPGGQMTPEVIKETRARKLDIALWTVDPSDWSKPGTNAIINRVLQQTKPGAVILMHDGGGDRSQTVAALPKIIRDLRARGYEFVTLDEIAGATR